MGDGLKLCKDKRHRSSSSLAGSALEGTRSDRRREKNASITEFDDQFSIAEDKCDELQEKIDLMKSLNRKKKLKKRSLIKVTESPQTPEHVPFISVRTQPKKKVSQQAARFRRLEIPQNPTRGYLDPATVEQHRMIGQVRGYNHNFKNPAQHIRSNLDKQPYSKLKRHRSHADGDSVCSHQSRLANEAQEVACGQDDIDEFANYDAFNQQADYNTSPVASGKKPQGTRLAKPTNIRRRNVSGEVPPNESNKTYTERGPADHWHGGPQGEIPVPRRKQPLHRNTQQPAKLEEERPVVELFNKSRMISPSKRRQGTVPMSAAPMNPLPAIPLDKNLKKVRNAQNFEDEENEYLESMPIPMEPKQGLRHPRRIKFRSRRYEMPTVASQMKQAGVRNYYSGPNHTNIPFVVSKSTAPSHNIGVNIQQVLNGLKIQQPLSGIPLTIAHHMGLGHVPACSTKSTTSNQQPSLDHHSEINAIRVGRRLVRLPSYKYISYNRMLNLYREGDGMVPRFLRAIARPHFFYTSMYNLATNREDFDCATSKGRGSHDAKQSLAEYASLYREYEHINKCINEGKGEPEMEQRKEELTKELATREEHIRRVVQEYRTGDEPEMPLRASVSTAEDAFRHSTFKVGDCQP